MSKDTSVSRQDQQQMLIPQEPPKLAPLVKPKPPRYQPKAPQLDFISANFEARLALFEQEGTFFFLFLDEIRLDNHNPH